MMPRKIILVIPVLIEKAEMVKAIIIIDTVWILILGTTQLSFRLIRWKLISENRFLLSCQMSAGGAVPNFSR